MSVATEAPPAKDDQLAADSVPTDLRWKTAAELRDQVATREELAEKRVELAAAQAELAEAKRGQTGFTGNETENETEVIHGRIRLVAQEKAHVERVEREIQRLEAWIWEPVHDVRLLQAALEAAETRKVRPSLETRADLLRLDEQRARRREAFEESSALLAAAKRELADLEDRAVNKGESVGRDIAKFEALVAQREREVRARTVAVNREIDETREREAELHAEHAASMAIEEDVRRERESAAAAAARIQERRRTMRALLELATALAADADVARRTSWGFPDELRIAIREMSEDAATRAAGVSMESDGPTWSCRIDDGARPEPA
ncbi:MAG: hypothetical protein M3T56_10310 [Chloroflexota bacterium]|nr:hypothetical protein [Chloroflexota bacterium]